MTAAIRRESGVGREGVGRVQPVDVRLGAEPCPLALRERDVAPGIELDRRVERRARRRGPPTPRGSRSRRTPAGPDRTARGASRASSMRPASNWARARAAIRSRCAAGSTVRPEPGHRARVAAGGGRGPVAGQLGDLERSDDATRVRRSTVAARRGAVAVRRRASGARPSVARAASRRRPDGRVARQRVGVEAARDGPQVEAGPAGQDRDPAVGREVPRGPPRA